MSESKEIGLLAKINNSLPAINTIALIAGGILGYWLIERQQLDESRTNVDLATSGAQLNRAQLESLATQKILDEIKVELAPLKEALSIAKTNGEIVLNLSQADLNETNSQLAKLELQINQANARIDNLSKKTAVSIDLSTLINEIQPVLRVTCSGTKPPSIVIDCTYENRGGHKVFVQAPEIELVLLGTDKLISKDTYTATGFSSNTVSPGTQGSDRIFVSFPDQNAYTKFTIKLRWDASLHSSVRTAVQPLLADIIDSEVFNSLASQGYTFRISYLGGG
jgi:hypothetical protein